MVQIMDKEKLLEIIKKGESSKVEFKLDDVHPDSLAAEIIAFSNLEGGLILLGVDDFGNIKGIKRENIEEWVINICRNNCDPSIIPIIEREFIDDKTILLVHIPRSYSVVSNKKGEYFIRVGSTKQKPTKEELYRLFQRAQMVNFEETPVLKSSIDDIDLKRVNNYFISKELDPMDIEKDLPLENQLINIGILDYYEDKLCATVCGLLTFGKNPQKYFPSLEARATYYLGKEMDNEVLESKDFGGTLSDIIEDSYNFVKKHVRVSSTIKELKRLDTPELPLDGIREAIVNAVAHRNYSIYGSAIRIFMFEDRLEIYSPGGLPNTLTLDNILYKQYSRNPTIVSYLSDLGYMEKRGKGILKILNSAKNLGLPKPKFEVLEEEFKVTFYKKNKK